MQLRRLALSTIAASALALAACGEETTHHAHSEGVYVTAGELQYQVQISRQLNPYSAEDQAYLVGLPRGERLGRGEEWFGVFLRAWNRTDEPQQTARTSYITDTIGRRFDPIPLNGRENVTIFRSWELKPGDQLPVPGSPARELNTQGGLILFKIPNRSFQFRPLTLHIVPPSGEPGEVTLDI